MACLVLRNNKNGLTPNFEDFGYVADKAAVARRTCRVRIVVRGEKTGQKLL